MATPLFQKIEFCESYPVYPFSDRARRVDLAKKNVFSDPTAAREHMSVRVSKTVKRGPAEARNINR